MHDLCIALALGGQVGPSPCLGLVARNCRRTGLPKGPSDGYAQSGVAVQDHDAMTASIRAMVPALVGVLGLAFLRGGMRAWAMRAASTSWHLRVSKAPNIARQDHAEHEANRRLALIGCCARVGLVEQLGQPGSISNVAAGDLRRLAFPESRGDALLGPLLILLTHVDTDMYLATLAE